MKKEKMSLVALCVLAMSNLSGCGGNNAAETIKIGLSGPLTGGAASYGTAVRDSANLAVSEINAKNGLQFEILALDDQLDPVTAQTNYTTLREQGMKISLGCVTSGACLTFGQKAKEDNMFCLTPSATNDDVPGTGVYQMCFKDAAQGELAATFIENNYKDAKVGIFYDSSDDYSNGIYEKFVANFKGNITATASFTKSTNTSFTAQIKTLENCDFIFMPIYYTEASIFVAQAKDVISKDAVYFGCDGLDGIETVEGFDANAYPQEISYLSHFNPKLEYAQDYIKNFTAAYPNTPVNQFGAAAYDCVYAIYNALLYSQKDVSAKTSVQEFYDILNGVFQDSNFSLNGVTGQNIKWNADRTVNKEPNKYVVNEDRIK